jgi:thiamine kinase-like enzyme
LYEKIEGKSLTEWLVECPDNVEQKAIEFASLHRRIHQVSKPHLPTLKATLNRNLQQVDCLTSDQKRKIFDYLDRLPDGEQVCHMDFHPDNILYSGKGPIIIDWMTAARGNPYVDVARTLVILKYGTLPSTIPESIILGLAAIRKKFASDYMQSYLQCGEMAKVEQWYLPIMAARLCEGIPMEEKEKLLREIHQQLTH